MCKTFLSQSVLWSRARQSIPGLKCGVYTVNNLQGVKRDRAYQWTNQPARVFVGLYTTANHISAHIARPVWIKIPIVLSLSTHHLASLGSDGVYGLVRLVITHFKLTIDFSWPRWERTPPRGLRCDLHKKGTWSTMVYLVYEEVAKLLWLLLDKNLLFLFVYKVGLGKQASVM